MEPQQSPTSFSRAIAANARRKVPAGIVSRRISACAACAEKCEIFDDDFAGARIACSRCRLDKWREFGACDQSGAKTKRAKIKGLGDIVAIVAEPIAKAAGIDKSKCGCARRREALNKMFPF